MVSEMATTSKVFSLLLTISALFFVFLGGGGLFLQVVTFINIPFPQLVVPSSCLMSLHESLTRTYPTGTVIWFVSVRAFPSSSAATRWTLKTEK